ncbi:MAG TPA: hypothetical protein VFK57_10905 [Vicinamibacterales bacterium]|nr:hypothetical protein [Vicinamibacterales bacterium]
MTVITTGVGAAAAGRAVGRYDRVFYGGVALAAAAMTLIGFGPTYYLRFFDGGPQATISGGPFSTVVHLHGALFTAWMLLFIVQTALISSRRVAVHRRLGVLGALLAAGMVVVGVIAGVDLGRRGAAPEGVDPLSFMAIPLGDMVMFGGFVAAALARRRDRESHKRLMLLAYASILAAPAARLPGVLPLGPLAFYAIGFLVLVAGVIYDYASRRTIHRVYLLGGGLLLLSVPLRLALSGTEAWRSTARMLIAALG